MPDPTTTLADYDPPDLDLPPAVAIVGGALLGGLAGFFFLTARGNRARHDIALAVDRMFDGLDTVLASWTHVQDRAAEAKRALASRDTRAGAGIDTDIS